MPFNRAQLPPLRKAAAPGIEASGVGPPPGAAHRDEFMAEKEVEEEERRVVPSPS